MLAKLGTTGLALLLAVGPAASSHAADTAPSDLGTMKSESFDADPNWDASNNRILPRKPRQVTQDFGYDAKTGDIGGRVTRAIKPAYYAAALEKPRTLNDKFSASGTFYLTQTTSGGGVFFGWFNSKQREGTGRPANSLGFEIGTERGGGRLAFRLLTAANHGAGKFVTKFEHYHDPAKKAEMRPTPIKNDGTRYTWSLGYDPDGAAGNGQMQFTIKSNLPQPQDFEGKVLTVDLPAGYKQEAGTAFDRFGLMNSTKPGGVVNIHLDDVTLDGKSFDFVADPNWVSSGSRAKYEEAAAVGAHNFGYSQGTHYAGGAKAGEMGGDMWRGGDYAYYADRVAPLTLNDPLEARGKVVLVSGAPDSDIFLGWFSGESKADSPVSAGNFLGVHVGGPSRVGHYFQPSLTTAAGNRAQAKDGPVMAHGKAYDWTLKYDPAAAAGNGAITVTLGDETVTLALKPGLKAKGARFDRFGLLTPSVGGQLVRIYLDDITYTARAK
jgi:hypothetical protein